MSDISFFELKFALATCWSQFGPWNYNLLIISFSLKKQVFLLSKSFIIEWVFLYIPIALLTHFYDLCFPLILDSSLVTSAPYDFQMDFDVVLKNIRELNILAGEGCSDVSRTKDGARLKVRNFCRTYNKEDNVGLFVD